MSKEIYSVLGDSSFFFSSWFKALSVSTGLAPPKGSGLELEVLVEAGAAVSTVRGFKLRRGRSEGRSKLYN